MNRQIPHSSALRPRIATIGSALWEKQTELSPAGAVLNSALALSRLGAQVAIRTNIGDDEIGRLTITMLSAAGINTEWVISIPGASTTFSELSTLTNSFSVPTQGVSLVRGDRIDIATLFAHDVVLLDIDEMPLLRFLVDLPAHTLPGTRLLGTLDHLATELPEDAFELLMRHDVVVGTPEDYRSITKTTELTDAIEKIQGRMRGSNLRAFVIAAAGNAPVTKTANETIQTSADLDSLPLDAFTGAIAFGMAARWDWSTALTFATCVANLSDVALFGPARFPTFEETIDVMYRKNMEPR